MKIELDHVSKYYQDNGKTTKGIEDITLEFETDGSFVVVTGESGSGKTTLIRVLTGIEDFDEGEIRFDGVELSSLSDADRIKLYQKNISFVFQDYNLVESFSAQENIVLALIKQGMKLSPAKKKAVEALAKVGMEKQKGMRTSKLSGGERQRVAIARSLALDAKVIIFDEPTGNLDQETSKNFIDLVASLCRDRLIIYVTHEYQQVVDVVTRHIVMADGSIIKDEPISNPSTANASPKDDHKTNRFSLINYLYASFLFSFRRVGRFIATFLVLLASAFAFFGAGTLASGISSLLLDATVTTVGSGIGNTVFLRKEKYDDPGYTDDIGFVDSFDILNPQKGNILKFYTYEKLDADYFLLADSDLSYPLNTALPNSYEVDKKADSVDENGFYLVISPTMTEYYDFSAIESGVGKDISLSPYSPYDKEILSESGYENTIPTIDKFPSLKFNGIYVSENDYVSNFGAYIYLPLNTLAANYDSLIQGVNNTSRSNTYDNEDCRVVYDGKELTCESRSSESGQSSIYLNTYWKDKDDITIDFFTYSIPLSKTTHVVYSDAISKYNYSIYGSLTRDLRQDFALESRVYYSDAETAKKKSEEISGYSVYYDGAYRITSNSINDFSSSNIFIRLVSFFIFAVILLLLSGILTIVRNILNKFYYRKDNDQMVLEYIGYSKKDMMAINLMQFLGLSVIFDALIYSLLIPINSTLSLLFSFLPYVFVLSILFHLAFSAILALPNRKKVN